MTTSFLCQDILCWHWQLTPAQAAIFLPESSFLTPDVRSSGFTYLTLTAARLSSPRKGVLQAPWLQARADVALHLCVRNPDGIPGNLVLARATSTWWKGLLTGRRVERRRLHVSAFDLPHRPTVRGLSITAGPGVRLDGQAPGPWIEASARPLASYLQERTFSVEHTAVTPFSHPAWRVRPLSWWRLQGLWQLLDTAPDSVRGICRQTPTGACCFEGSRVSLA